MEYIMEFNHQAQNKSSATTPENNRTDNISRDPFTINMSSPSCLRQSTFVSSDDLENKMAIVIKAGVGITVVAGISVGAYHFFKTTNEKILDIIDLTKGDQIKFDRGLYFHHAVVVDVDVDSNSYKVIHFLGDKKNGIPAEIKEEILTFKRGEIILIRYRYGRLDRYITVERAYRLLRAQEKSTCAIIYDLLLNNCEHFATWCITGKASSTQVNKVLAPFAPIINMVGEIQRPY